LREHPWDGYASEEEQREAINLQNMLIEVGRSVEGLLAPRQIEALALAKEIRKFWTLFRPIRPSTLGFKTNPLAQLQEENLRLKGLVAELTQDKTMLQDVL